MTDNRETIEMLKMLKEQALKSHNDTAVLEVKIDSFNFVLDEAIKALKQKTGWHIAHGMYEDRFWCSCGFIKVMDSNMIEWKYCPNCGARMIEPQESEEI